MLPVLEAIHRRRGQAPPPRPGTDRQLRVVGYLMAGPDADNLATVSVLGSEPIEKVPATPSTYTGVTTVNVLLDPSTGRPVMVVGPAGEIPVAPEDLPSPPAASGSSVRAVTSRVVTPTSTGTFRVSRGAWGRWNDAADVYQAGSSSSGTLLGLATYGDQIKNLGASAITRAKLTLVSNGAGFLPSFSAVVQGSASGTRPAGQPSYTGDTATVSVPGYGKSGQSASVDLGATMREDLRTGAIKSLGLVGAEYGGTLGLGRHGAAWVLTLDYEVTG